MAAFPDYARILLAGYAERPDFGVTRTETDGGVAKTRRQWSLPIVSRSATILVESPVQKVAFDTWMRVDLNRGSAWFDWEDPLDGKTKKMRFKGGAIQWTSPGVAWTGACELETIYEIPYSDVQVGRLAVVQMSVPTQSQVAVGRMLVFGMMSPSQAQVAIGRLTAVAMIQG